MFHVNPSDFSHFHFHIHTHHTLHYVLCPKPCFILACLVAVLFVFQVGAKCKVELEHESEMYTCHVQFISKDKTYCVVFVEAIGKKLGVPLFLPVFVDLCREMLNTGLNILF